MHPTTKEIWYPDTDFVEFITSELVPILFAHYESKPPDFQYLGGNQGLGQLESALARPKPLFGQERYPSIADKAAALTWAITKNHPYTDGNKRAAPTTGFSFLIANRYFVLADQDDAVQMCIGIADNRIGHDESYVANLVEGANFVFGIDSKSDGRCRVTSHFAPCCGKKFARVDQLSHSLHHLDYRSRRVGRYRH